MAEQKAFDVLSKVAVFGASGVGKTKLIAAMVGEAYDEGFYASIGVDFRVETVSVGTSRVKLQIWDTAGCERYRPVIAPYCRGLKIGMLCFDLSDSETAESNLQDNLMRARSFLPDDRMAHFVVVGCKQDLKKNAPQSVLDFCHREKLEYIETSSKTNYGHPDFISRIANLSLYGSMHAFRRERAKEAADSFRNVWEKSNRVISSVFIPRDVLNLLCSEIERDAETEEKWGLPSASPRVPKMLPRETTFLAQLSSAKSIIIAGVLAFLGMVLAWSK